ncbi:unnamed protein product [Leptidea sinapis]|uniref:Zinc finger RING-H2-type domain-containing protein n=1 Tax=Leptidea sinapis TaxID=189913 RepID=A0A5E4QVU1_9NEOP|nr:unnamed protein product [Leptidea sinapis]
MNTLDAHACLRCQGESKKDSYGKQDCVVVWGECNHSFHFCCMSLWILRILLLIWSGYLPIETGSGHGSDTLSETCFATPDQTPVVSQSQAFIAYCNHCFQCIGLNATLKVLRHYQALEWT